MSPYTPSGHHRDPGFSVLGILASVVINGGLFASMAWAGMTEGKQVEEPLEVMWVDPVIPKQGTEEPPKNQLPRITKPAPPPPPPTENVIKTGPREEELQKKKAEEAEKRRLAAEKRREELERKKRLAEERRRKRDEKRKRDRAMASAFDNLDDRAEDAPEVGRKDGLNGGNSTSGTITAQMKYVARLNTIVGRQLKIPPIPREDRKKVVKVRFQLEAMGDPRNLKAKTKSPKVVKSSGNRSCDSAFVAAVRRFGEDSPNIIPLPSDEVLRKNVLKRGVTLRQSCGGGK